MADDRSTDFFIFRHGETDWNLEGRIQGHEDVPLNSTGREQARQIKSSLLKLDCQVVVSSDLSRARETAEIIFGETDIPFETTEALREANLGVTEGMLRSEVESLLGPGKWKKWTSSSLVDLDFSFERGESKRSQLHRARKYLKETADQHPLAQRIAVSTHGGVIRRLVENADENHQSFSKVPNCTVYRMHFKDEMWFFLGEVARIHDAGSSSDF